MKLIGKAPNAQTYLVADSDFDISEHVDAKTQARVLRVSESDAKLHPPQRFHSILGHIPQIEPYEGEEGELDELLSRGNINTDALATR